MILTKLTSHNSKLDISINQKIEDGDYAGALRLSAVKKRMAEAKKEERFISMDHIVDLCKLGLGFLALRTILQYEEEGVITGKWFNIVQGWLRGSI